MAYSAVRAFFMASGGYVDPQEDRERFEISDDEMLKTNLYAPGRSDPGFEERGY
jgi:protein subunit release factor B